jgi:hypothetical protein
MGLLMNLLMRLYGVWPVMNKNAGAKTGSAEGLAIALALLI